MANKQTQSKAAAAAVAKAASAQSSAAASPTPATPVPMPPAKKKTPVDTVATVRAVGVERRCRAGMCFDQEGSKVDFAELDEERIRALIGDPHLQIDAAQLAAGEPTDDKEDAA